MGERDDQSDGLPTPSAGQVESDVQRQLMQLKDELHDVTRAHRAVLDASAEAIITLDQRGRVRSWNRAAEIMFQRDAADMLGRGVSEIIAERFRSQHEAQVERLLASAQSAIDGNCFEAAGLRADGSEIPMEIALSRWPSSQGPITTGILRDITDRKVYERRLKQVALHDPLTGLPNRILFFDRLERAIKSSQRNRRMAAVLLIDLDGFKRINEELGHPTGDRVLKGVAAELTECLRDADSIGRFGDDEFLVLLSDLVSRQAVTEVAERVLACTRGPMGDTGYLGGVSLGISLYPGDGTTAEALVERACEAMLKSKETGRGSYQFFDGGGEPEAAAHGDDA